MKRTTLLAAMGVVAAVALLALAVVGLRSLLYVPPGSTLQVLLRHDGRPASGHIEVRNARGDVIRKRTIGSSGDTTTHLGPGRYTVVNTDDAHCVSSPDIASIDNSPNAVFVQCRS